MKRKLIPFFLIFAGTFFVQVAKAECNTQTRTAFDQDGNVVASATCTRCDDDPVIARIQAGACADAGLKAMLPQEPQFD